MKDATTSVPSPQYKLGLNPPDPARRTLKLRWTEGVPPHAPPADDHFAGWSMDMGANNRFGTCGPTSLANSREMTTALLTGVEDETSEAEVFDLYRRSGNPTFDPRTGRGDNGVVMSVMMDACTRGGLGGSKLLGYAELADRSDLSVYAAINRFGGVLFAVTLQTAQSRQTDVGLWDYQRSGMWGGHAILAASYDQPAGRVDVVTWQKRVGTTAAFRRNQLDEVWVPLWPELLTAGKLFDPAIDLAQLARDYEQLTGRAFPVPIPPAPPIPPADSQIRINVESKTVSLPAGWTVTPNPAG